jgi:osmotically inducible protein OsmC
MAAERRAEVTWQGSLMEGAGTIDRVGSGAFGPLDITWASRAEDPDGRTSPEELIAAAHASCFSMALSNLLSEGGSPPDSVTTDATVTLRIVDGAPTITTIVLSTVGRVPGIDDATFQEQARNAKEGCPVIRALAGVGEVTLDARLES